MATKKPSTRKSKKQPAQKPAEPIEETTTVAEKTEEAIPEPEPEPLPIPEDQPEGQPEGDPQRAAIAFVIPYVDSTAKWEELRYALRSIAKNSLPHDKVFIVGAAPALPEWISEEVTLIECEQVSGKRFSKSFDAVEKLKAVIAHPDVPEEFIYTYDDTIFLQTIHAIVPTIAVAEIDLASIARMDGSSIWKEVLNNTYDRLKANKLPLFNYETHLPRTLEKSKLAEVFNKFGFIKRPYLVSTIYFNYFHPEPEYQLIKDDYLPIKADIRSALPPDEIAQEVEGKAFLNFNDAGLNQYLKDFLSKTFNEKCRFEK